MASTLAELVARFGGELLGDGGVAIHQVAPLDRAQAGEIGFVSQSKYLAQLADTRAAAVILPTDARDATELPRILTPNPYLYFARVSAVLNPPPRPPAGIHPAATVAPAAETAADARVGADCLLSGSRDHDGHGELHAAMIPTLLLAAVIAGAPAAQAVVRGDAP